MPFYQATVTHGDDEDREVLRESQPFHCPVIGAGAAAERYVEDNFDKLDWPKEVNVLVLNCKTDEITEWTVTVVSQPVFNASPVQAVGRNEAASV